MKPVLVWPESGRGQCPADAPEKLMAARLYQANPGKLKASGVGQGASGTWPGRMAEYRRDSCPGGALGASTERLRPQEMMPVDRYRSCSLPKRELYRAKKVKALRLWPINGPSFPEVPTLKELGVTGPLWPGGNHGSQGNTGGHRGGAGKSIEKCGRFSIQGIHEKNGSQFLTRCFGFEKFDREREQRETHEGDRPSNSSRNKRKNWRDYAQRF